MSLPKVEVPTYELTLPSEDKKVKFRPFLVKEEKVLYVALESGDSREMVNALKEIINACTFNLLKVEQLPIFDIEYIFLQIRAKSVSEISKFKVICPDDGITYAEAEIDLTKVEVHVEDTHTNKILVDENKNLGLVLRYPTLKNYEILKNKKDTVDIENMFNILIDCIDHIFEGEKIYPAKDATKKDLKEFIENLSPGAFDKVRKFFDSMPKVEHTIEVTNPKTGKLNNIKLTGISDFFELASPTTR